MFSIYGKNVFLFFLAGILMSSSPPNPSRMLVSSLRGGDYVHAGDKEAIDMVLSRVLEISPYVRQGPALDLGSGFGGTAYDLYQEGFKEVYGIDIDAAAVSYARKRYPLVSFFVEDALCVDERFSPSFFSFISLFNVLYAIPEKKELLEKLFNVAMPGAILVLFDYTTQEAQNQLVDLSGKPIYPIQLEKIEQDLIFAGWKIVEVMDLSSQFVNWYQKILDKLEKEENAFLLEDIEKVRSTFASILFQIKQSKLGGAVIYAQKLQGGSL